MLRESQMTRVVSRSERCEASQPVVQASARRETSHRCPPGLGARHFPIAKTACRCSALCNAKGGPLDSTVIDDARGRARLCAVQNFVYLSASVGSELH